MAGARPLKKSYPRIDSIRSLNEDIKIHNIHLNPDAIKKTQIWKDLRIALKDARKRFQTEVSAELTTTKTGKLDIGSVKISPVFSSKTVR